MKLRKGGLIVPSLTVPQLEADFSGGSPLDVFDQPNSTVPPTVEPSGGWDDGPYGVWAPAASTAFTRWRAVGGSEQSIPAGQSCWSVRMYLRYPTALPGGATASIFSVVQATGTDDFTFFFNPATSRLQWDLDALDTERSDPIDPDVWYLIEAKGEYNGSTWTANVRIDGIPQLSVATSGAAQSTIDFIQFGISSATQTWTGHFDDCAFAYGTSPLRFIGPA
jgi:hypothetical protein